MKPPYSTGSNPTGPDDRALDELLGVDPTPRLSAEVRARLLQQLSRSETLGEAGQSETRVLDALLELDQVDVPAGLARRIVAGTRGARGLRRRSRARRVAPLLLAAAAATIVAIPLWPTGDSPEGAPSTGRSPGAELDGQPGGNPGGSVGAMAAATETEIEDAGLPSDQLLASMALLDDLSYEDVLFLTEELDPLEAEALFLFETEDELLFDLLMEAGVLEENG